MKTIRYTWLLSLAFAAAALVSCNKEDEYFKAEYQSVPIVIEQIYLEDYESSVPDRPVDFARLGQMIRVEGSGLYGMKEVYINGYETYFNRAYVTDNSMLIQINTHTPVTEADPAVRDKIRFVKDATETVYDFEIRAASPSVTGINQTLPSPGETVIVYGTNLHETVAVTLPGGMVVTDITNDEEDGEWYSFVMPDGVTEGGCLYSEGAHGFAQTPDYFNERRGIILDFEIVDNIGSWSATYSPDDLVDDPLDSGRETVCLAVPESVLSEGGIAAGAVAKGWFTAGNDCPADDWSRFYELIPEDTPVSEIAFQFDVYVPEDWTTGMLEFTFQNNLSNYGYGSTETTNTTNIEYPTAVVWVPWLVDGAQVAYKNEGWTTITIPVNTVGKYQNTEVDNTFGTVVADRNAASYRNFGMFLVNNEVEYSDDVTFDPTIFNQRVYVDNWRIVPYKSVTVSDYPEDEEE